MKRELVDVIHDVVIQALTNVHTITVAIVTGVDEKTINVAPVVNRVVNGRSIKLPEFISVPPIFLQGGSSYTAHPISVGDSCLLLISERCFDAWYVGSNFVSPPEFRMHDYSDGFALVGVNPLEAAITIPQVITQIGDTYQQGDYIHDGSREQTGNQIVNGNVTINGNLEVNGNITCTGVLTIPTINATGGVTIAGIDYGTHTHSGVQTGSGSTGGPQ